MSAAAPKNVARFLEWDTQFFGVRIATIELDAISDADWRQQLAWCQLERIQCLYVLRNTKDNVAARNTGLIDAGHVDLRTTFERATLPLPGSKPCKATFRPARASDTPALRAMAMTAHKDSRFWKDPRFPRERCEELYGTWIERSIQGWADAVFVAEMEGSPVGYITGHVREGQVAEIGLVAVAEARRGERIGGALVREALCWAEYCGLGRTRVVTQGENTPAVLLYAAAGFETTLTQHWYHLWFK